MCSCRTTRPSGCGCCAAPACTANFYDSQVPPDYAEPALNNRGRVPFYVQQGAGVSLITRPLAQLRRGAGSSYMEVGCGYGFGLDFALNTQRLERAGDRPGAAGGPGAGRAAPADRAALPARRRRGARHDGCGDGLGGGRARDLAQRLRPDPEGDAEAGRGADPDDAERRRHRPGDPARHHHPAAVAQPAPGDPEPRQPGGAAAPGRVRACGGGYRQPLPGGLRERRAAGPGAGPRYAAPRAAGPPGAPGRARWTRRRTCSWRSRVAPSTRA